jgi:hypothetical protein
MSAIPGWHRASGDVQSGCGCLVIGAIFGLLTGAAMLALGLYATRIAQ